MSNRHTEMPAAPDSDVIELDDDDLIEFVDAFDLSDVTGGCGRCGCGRVGGVAVTHTTGGFGVDPALAVLAMYAISKTGSSSSST
jgi:hypothetical protein